MKRKLAVLALALGGMSGIVGAQSQTRVPSPQRIPLTSTRSLKMVGLDAQVVDFKGRKAIRLAEDRNVKSAEPTVLLPNTEFENGTIELEVAAQPRPNAPPDVPGFVGIAFRVAPDASKYEYFYLRPANGRSQDQLRRNHSTQYASHPDYVWRKLREEHPGVYESYVDLVPGRWTKMKIEVDGTRARLFVDKANEPCLVVNDLKLGEARGGIGLWIGPDTVAYYSDLRITRASPGPAVANASH